jgi:hypothetical protein
MKTKPIIFLSALALAASTLSATAQDTATPKEAPKDGGTNNQGGGRQRGGPGGSMQDFMQRMNERLKTSLKVTDEEWTVLQPLIEKVQAAQREASAGRGFSGRGGSPGGSSRDNTSGGNPPTDTRPGSAESAALRAALESDSTTAEDIKAKLAALREVRKKGVADLAVARENLKNVVTMRQEAVLVSIGLLE